MFPAVPPYPIQGFACDGSALHLNSEAVRNRFAKATDLAKCDVTSIKKTDNRQQWVADHIAVVDDAAAKARIKDSLEYRIFRASCACWMKIKEVYVPQDANKDEGDD